MPAVNPYSTAVVLNRPVPTYVPNPDDKIRVQAYWTYQDIYNNVPEAFFALLRAEDDPKSRRYIPFGRALVEAVNRYLAKNLTWVPSVPANEPTMSEEDIAAIMAALDALFKREAFNARFMGMKRNMLIKGDGVLQISADPAKPEGTRIRITELSPEQYFPIYDSLDKERVVGVYIITLQTSPDGQTTVAQREEYRRILTEEDIAEFGVPAGSIFYRMSFWEQGKWDDRFPLSEEDLVGVEFPKWMPLTAAVTLQLGGYALPATITSIPFYHFKNSGRGSGLFGMSEMQGIESMLAGIIQNATDEDMAVALSGLGVYWTDSGHPVKADGTEEDWVISPATVLELQEGKKFGRVDGITTVQPIQDHIRLLQEEAQQTSGTPDVAMGTVDVAIAESGIALALKMAPVLSKNEETEVGLNGGLDQLMFDLLHMWLPAYEGAPVTPLIVESRFSSGLPVDQKGEVERITALVTAGIVDAQFGRDYLADRLGIQFPPDMETRMAAAKQAELDAVGTRLDAAAGAPVDTGTEEA